MQSVYHSALLATFVLLCYIFLLLGSSIPVDSFPECEKSDFSETGMFLTVWL